ncbi:RNA polymerase sigma factor [Salibacter halophilus]|jgi:RNA polymerase sigma-70 factor (ECF subfamily)|uniref:Sigma-70 family RNA polymerase sigma factor n=1 Tax=Salibacter halophilus TaxID=1803916 RepID=A0A6N6M5A4_9FLAO|nr:sigma-70 family RNA polymerase sigma factor [Salibacter halophilus]KAB1064789.1 sigma-70 family RNA polymerase sigma factor [Salibacter halophilus]
MLCANVSDKELVSQYLRGKEQALEILITRHKERVFTYIVSLVKDRQLADDIFQDVFIKVVNTLKRGKYNEEGKFLPWVMRISHNLVIDNFRALKRNPTIDGGGDFDIFDLIKREDPNAEDQLVWDQITGDLKEIIEELPDEQREVLKMRHYGQMSFKEIAEETNVSINTALGRMRYALINMRKTIEERRVDLLKH